MLKLNGPDFPLSHLVSNTSAKHYQVGTLQLFTLVLHPLCIGLNDCRQWNIRPKISNLEMHAAIFKIHWHSGLGDYFLIP